MAKQWKGILYMGYEKIHGNGWTFKWFQHQSDKEGNAANESRNNAANQSRMQLQ